MSMVKFKTGIKFVCDNCGLSDDNLSRFNDYDCDTKQHYCLKCHPSRMSFRQLIEWLAKGNGYLCQQGKDYTTAPTFSMSPVIINGKRYTGKFDDQVPYDEHELVVSEFKDGFSNWKMPTYEMYKRDCKEAKCTARISPRGAGSPFRKFTKYRRKVKTMPNKPYPLHPGQTHAEPYYCTIPLEEYEALKKRVRQLEHVCKINGIVVPGISDYTMSQPPFKEGV